MGGKEENAPRADRPAKANLTAKLDPKLTLIRA
jgi:hypothetical protein